MYKIKEKLNSATTWKDFNQTLTNTIIDTYFKGMVVGSTGMFLLMVCFYMY